jgi:PadR family transcriptional regulator PadR
MASKNYFLNGVAELLILSILKKNDTYIYDIKKIISKISNDSLPMSQNTIYAAAYKLENEGKITEYSKLVGRKRTRIYYHIENSGLEYLNKLTSDYKMVTTNVGNILNFLANDMEGK